MASSACDDLQQEAGRFTIYVFADNRLKNSVHDKDSFVKAISTAFNSDPTMRNLLDDIKRKGDNPDICLEEIFQTKEIQDLVAKNRQNTEKEMRKRVRKDHPAYKGKKFTNEVNRRVNISFGVMKARQSQLKQVTIEDALKPIHVQFTNKQGKVITYRKAVYKPLSTQEENLIVNNIKRGKTPTQVIDIYQQTMSFRSKTSIKRHYWRLKKKFNI